MNNIKSLAILLNKCATSAPTSILFVCGLISTISIVPTALAISDQQQYHVIASTDMHNLMDHSMAEHSNNRNNIQKNNGMTLSASLLTQSLNGTTRNGNANINHGSEQFEMENSQKYLHLDEQNFVATTPKIHTTKLPNRYEQGLEDYEEAVARVDKIKEQQRQQQANGISGFDIALSLIQTASNVWSKVSSEYEQRPSTMQSTITDKSNDGQTNNTNNNNETRLTDIAEARFIQGDPLKGYYDFVITEGSYKFWAIFQLFTAGLMIYSTFAAIYYSKVNPIVGDYDYTSYLGGARSMADDPEPMQSSSPWSELSNSYIFQTASHGFQFVLDAIEKVPKT